MPERRAVVAVAVAATIGLVVGGGAAVIVLERAPQPHRSAESSPRATTTPPRTDRPGVPPGTELEPARALTVILPRTVVDGRDVLGPIKVEADDVTIRNTRVTDGGWTVIEIAQGVTGTRIVNVEVGGLGHRGQPGSVGIAGPATILRTDIHGVENAIIPGSGSVIRDSWIHDLAAAGADPHYDGIQIDGGQQHVLIEDNVVDLTNHDRTSAVMIDNDFGPVHDVTIRGNRLLGGSFTVYADGKFSTHRITDIAYLDNRMRSGVFGYSLIRDASVTWDGNVDDASGRTVHVS